MSLTTYRNLVILLLLALWITGCSSIATGEQSYRTHFETLETGTSIGQSFVSRYEGLNGVNVYLAPQSDGAGEIQFQLYKNLGDSQPIRTSSLEVEQIDTEGYYGFFFPPLNDSANQNYFLRLSLQGSNEFRIGAANGTRYLNGALYTNTQPQDSQLTFQLQYRVFDAMVGVLGEIGIWLTKILGSIFLFILPGWGFLKAFLRNWNSQHWSVKLGLSAGMSLAIYPLVFLWSDLAGINLDLWFPILMGILGISLIAWFDREKILALPEKIQSSNRRFPAAVLNITSIDILNFLVIALIVTSRFWIVRGLVTPIGSDPVHHTMITQLLYNNHGLFDEWLPYNELQSFTYHFGFHSAATSFMWLFGLSSSQTVLWMGQVINVLAVVAVVPLAARISQSVWAGVLALLLAGLLSHMPNYFLNWGRYTHLTALVILPAAVVMIWDFFDSRKFRWALFIPVIILWAGLGLTHYRVLALAILFIPVYWFFSLGQRSIVSTLLRTAGIGFGALLLTFPWIINVFQGRTPNLLAKFVTNVGTQIGIDDQFGKIGDLSVYLSIFFWILLFVSMGWGFWKRNRRITLISAWWFLAILVANPNYLNLPGKGALSNKIVFYSLYLPASAVSAAFISWYLDSLTEKISKPLNRRILYFIFIILLVAAGILGTYNRLHELRPDEIFVTQPDIAAMEWINDNVDQDAIFLINSYFGFGMNWVIGNDAGWWIPLLANRKTNLPPMVYVVEKGPTPEYSKFVSQLPFEINQEGITHSDVLEMIKERGITHLYIGQLHGGQEANYNLLPLNTLLEDSRFKLIYHQDRVWIFEIVL